ncbi:DUF3160 domain-containing protein [Polyangium sp. 15x6]|uniref:DUF3160 domain-containing protein n=1 Tax=Polyangium sp. 15x6 TaxID=3042687 RepID=UPI00249C3B34|nr:DUF3160 domain-containing protein [Polyangium sp. 15x6]MDI3290675.1 DUF3160 domain-containing protein [Polyangium sp. 15x6]
MTARSLVRLTALFALAAALGAACHRAGDPALDRPGKNTPQAALTASSASSASQAPVALPGSHHSAAFLALGKMETAEACALPTTVPAMNARPGAKAFEVVEAHCTEDAFCDRVDVAPKGADACFVSDDHIRDLEKKVSAAGGAAGRSDPWNGVKKPKFLDRIDAHLHLDDAEEALLRKNGFVVLDRLAYSDYATAFHDIFQEELPLYVGPDPILFAAFRATDNVLGQAERKRLAPALKTMLGKLKKGLAAPKGAYDEVTRKDLDLYLAVAIELVREYDDNEPSSLFGQKDAALAIVEAITRAELAPISIFGRERMMDFSQFTPRGHYAGGDVYASLQPYFRAITWLSRFEWNLVSRGSRSSHPGESPDLRETPREARDALALADLFRRSGALGELAAFEEIYTAFGGRREDVGMPELLKLMDKHGIKVTDPEAPEKLKVAIGTGYRRTARFHFMPQGVTDLPVISTVIGPRIAPDIAPLERLVHDAVPDRFELGAADVGYMLGHDRAAAYLKEDLARYPSLQGALDAARAEVASRTKQSKDVQGSFFGAVLALAAEPKGRLPSFMQRDAYADLRLSSALVGYAELRHIFVLLDGQGYDAYGCAIPDAYVEPLAPFYAALLEHTERLRKVAGGGFDGLLRVLRVLSTITKTELARGAPTAAQATWLGMVAEYIPEGGYADSGEPPKWTGWYYDMFEDREDGAGRSPELVADYFTLTNAGKVAYLGTESPRLGVFVVDTGGEPRAMVGPVARGYELTGPIAARLDDEAARKSPGKRAPFRESFAAKPWTEPPLGLGVNLFECTREGKLEARLVLAADRPVGPVTVALLDHHADPLAPSLTLNVDDGLVVFPFFFPEVAHGDADAGHVSAMFGPRGKRYRSPIEALSVRAEDLTRAGLGKGSYDYFTSPSVLSMSDGSDGFRPVGTLRFVIGGAWEAPQPPVIEEVRDE